MSIGKIKSPMRDDKSSKVVTNEGHIELSGWVRFE